MGISPAHAPMQIHKYENIRNTLYNLYIFHITFSIFARVDKDDIIIVIIATFCFLVLIIPRFCRVNIVGTYLRTVFVILLCARVQPRHCTGGKIKSKGVPSSAQQINRRPKK